MKLKTLFSAIFLCLALMSGQARSELIYDFDIRVNFGAGLTESQQLIFNDAENFWESIIVGYQNEYAGPGLDINASAPYIDGVGGTLGSAGPEYGIFLPTYVYATQGSMRFDSADLANMESAGSLFDVIVHEMAHVIGFGTLWSIDVNQLLNDDGNYIGEHALAAYQQTYPNATFVPVEQGGGRGTAGGHWDEPDGGGDPEIMTGWLDYPTTISLTTIHSFADLGYVINPQFAFAVDEPAMWAILMLGLLGFRKRRANLVRG